MYNRPVFLTCLHTFLLLATIFAFFSMFHVSYATVINVPQDYPTIQQAINEAVDGDTIYVGRRSGESQSIYYERLLIEEKQLRLVGESRETIIIDGDGVGTVIRIRWDNVEIRGFTIRNGQQYTGIRVNSYSHITIINNTIETNKNGISLLNSNYNTIAQNELVSNSATGISLSESVGNNVSDNDVSESAYGIKLSTTNATFVVNNTVADNSYGIYLAYSSNDTVDKNTVLRNSVDGIFPYKCNDIVVSNNEISESAYGIQLNTADTVTVIGNNVTGTGNSFGIYLASSGPSNTIENNTISRHDWGVTLHSSSGNTFKGNTLSYNTWGVDPVTESINNLFYHNNFVENVEQVVWNPDYVNTWDNGYPSGGNYWNDYTGTDSDGDGIGDTAYIIDPVNKDRYPLMTPWGIVHDVAVISVTPSDTNIYVGETVSIRVVAENQGTQTEIFDVTTYYNTTATEWTVIENQTVTNLAPSTNMTLTFYWSTPDVFPGLYQIKAEASVVPSETDTADNVYIDGIVTVLASEHDVAIVSVLPSYNSVYVGYSLNITVTAKNEGLTTESFNVTLYNDADIIGTQRVNTLEAGAEKLLKFTWNTTNVSPANYTIKAEAEVLPEEFDTLDNVYVYGLVNVKIQGDVNGDGIVDILDKTRVHYAWCSSSVDDPATPWDETLNWDQEADQDYDGNIDVIDVVLVNQNYGQSI